MKSLALSVSALLLLALAIEKSQSPPQYEPSEFLSFRRTKPGEGLLETSIVTYKRDGVTIDLLGAVHVAEARYYNELEKRFATYDKLLYELIKEKDDKPVPRGGGGGIIGTIQRLLKNVLDLEFQLDAIDYNKKNFVHADLDPQTFVRLQNERGESIIGFMIRAMFESWKLQAQGKGGKLDWISLLAAFSSEDRARRLKFLLAQELEHVEELLAGLDEGGDGKGSVILTERNKVAIRVLERELQSGIKRIGIFYGAAHMPDMERRLIQDLGFKKVEERWITAWDAREKTQKSGENEGEKEDKSGTEKGAEEGGGKAEEGGGKAEEGGGKEDKE